MGWEQICINFVPKRVSLLTGQEANKPLVLMGDYVCLPKSPTTRLMASFYSRRGGQTSYPWRIVSPKSWPDCSICLTFRVLIICDLSFLFLFACLFWYILILKWHFCKCDSNPLKDGAASWWWIWWKRHNVPDDYFTFLSRWSKSHYSRAIE